MRPGFLSQVNVDMRADEQLRELPSNALLAGAFREHVDGFSIGSKT
jgi:hypothetical protein